MNWSEFIIEIENGLLGRRYSDYDLAGVIDVKREVIYKIRTGLTLKPQQSTISKLEEG
jgi:ribosome-binding protein aMBF1 (putative translation factor)